MSLILVIHLVFSLSICNFGPFGFLETVDFELYEDHSGRIQIVFKSAQSGYSKLVSKLEAEDVQVNIDSRETSRKDWYEHLVFLAFDEPKNLEDFLWEFHKAADIDHFSNWIDIHQSNGLESKHKVSFRVEKAHGLISAFSSIKIRMPGKVTMLKVNGEVDLSKVKEDVKVGADWVQVRFKRSHVYDMMSIDLESAGN